MATVIDDTARVDARAVIGDDVAIGPYCVVGPDVTIGRGTRLVGHAWIEGFTTLGVRNLVGPFAAIGGEPQDVSYRGAPTRVEIGDDNVFHERISIHRATEKEDGVTRVGSRVVLRANCHVAHDCRIGDDASIGEGVLLGGHVRIGAGATMREASVALQFVTIGMGSHVAPKTKVGQDLPCFLMAEGNPGVVRRIFVAGLKRAGVDAAGIRAMHEAHRLIYRAKLGVEPTAKLLASRGPLSPEVAHLLDFLRSQQGGKDGRARGNRGKPA